MQPLSAINRFLYWEGLLWLFLFIYSIEVLIVKIVQR